MTWDSYAGNELALRPSPLESARFGISVSRLTVGWQADELTAAEFVTANFASARDHLVIARWPTHMLTIGSAAATSSRKILIADVLVYWEAPPDRVLALTAPPVASGLSVTPACATGEHASRTVEDIVRDSFRQYGSHYVANPDIDPAAALDGYVEWVDNTLARRPEDVLLLREDERAVGLAAVVVGAEGHDLEIELAGLRSADQGRGWYAALLHACAAEATSRGCHRLIISTQVHNIRVQRAWTRVGLAPFAALSTAHASSWAPHDAGESGQGNHTSAGEVENV
jgi:ribosomal protein S18 acetylase RimI-like enzyme